MSDVTPLMQQYLLDHLLMNRVHHASASELLELLPDNSIDLIVTSPPYDNLRTYNGYSFLFEEIARESYRVLKAGGVLVWVVGDASIDNSETFTSLRQALFFRDGAGFNAHDTMIYNRNGRFPESNRYWQDFEYMFVFSKGRVAKFNPLKERSKSAGRQAAHSERQPDGSLAKPKNNRKRNEFKNLSNVWYIPNGYGVTTKDSIAYEHPAMFPEELAERHILTWSNPGDTVLDYFGGSGTTAKMALHNGRKYITGDISADYCELMRKRLAQPFTVNMFTGVA